MGLITSYQTSNVFSCDGSTTIFNFSFLGGYIDKTHVKAKYTDSVGNVTTVVITAGNFIGPYQLNITPAPLSGGFLTIYRDTPKAVPLVDFADGARISEASLDIVAKQALFVAAESNDLALSTLRVPEASGIPVMPSVAGRKNRIVAFDDAGDVVMIPGVDGTSAASLALDLTNTSLDAKGASLVGFNSALNYTIGSVGAFLKRIVLDVANKLTVAKLLVNSSSDPGTPDAAVLVRRTLTSLTAGGGHDFRTDTTISGGVAGTGHAGFDAANTLSATGFDHIVSYQSRPVITGNPTHVYGMTHTADFGAGANAVNSYAVYAYNPGGAGTVQNLYGLFVPQLTKGSLSNYPIYIAQQGSPSFIGSPLNINNLVTIAPGAPFILGGANTSSYPHIGYNFDPATDNKRVNDVAVTCKFDNLGFRVFTKAAGAPAGAGTLATMTEGLRVDIAGNHYGVAGIAGMTNGFNYVPTGAGLPGTPAVVPSGRVPMYFNSATNKLGVYSGGVWLWSAAFT